MKTFERVYQLYAGDEHEGPSIRVQVSQASDGDWLYELPDKFSHWCDSDECPDADRLAISFLTG